MHIQRHYAHSTHNKYKTPKKWCLNHTYTQTHTNTQTHIPAPQRRAISRKQARRCEAACQQRAQTPHCARRTTAANLIAHVEAKTPPDASKPTTDHHLLVVQPQKSLLCLSWESIYPLYPFQGVICSVWITTIVSSRTRKHTCTTHTGTHARILANKHTSTHAHTSTHTRTHTSDMMTLWYLRTLRKLHLREISFGDQLGHHKATQVNVHAARIRRSQTIQQKHIQIAAKSNMGGEV